MALWYLLPVIGLATGTVGTLVGAGGGFLLVPLLLLLYPDDPPQLITRISLTVVFFNALSGTIAYSRQRRIDYRAGLTFAAGIVPGAIVGALATRLLERESFDVIFGAFLALVAVVILLRPTLPIRGRTQRTGEALRTLQDAQGHTYVYSFSPSRGVLLSLGVGFIASLFGIGGGSLQVPALILVLNFPTHIATATSQFMLMITGLTGTLTHMTAGDLHEGWRRAALLAVGVVAGAPLGARLALRLRGDLIARILGLALAAVAARLMVAGLAGWARRSGGRPSDEESSHGTANTRTQDSHKQGEEGGAFFDYFNGSHRSVNIDIMHAPNSGIDTQGGRR